MNNLNNLKNNVKKGSNEIYKKTKYKAENLVDTAENLKNDVRSYTKDKVEDMRDGVQSLAGRAKDEASDMYQSGKKTVRNVEDEICGYVSALNKKIADKPMLSVLSVVGISFAFFSLLKSKK